MQDLNISKMIQDTTEDRYVAEEETVEPSVASAVDTLSAERFGSEELDVDAWFRQREAIIDKLKASRIALLEQVRQTEARLAVLGVRLSDEDAQEGIALPVQRAPRAGRATRSKAKQSDSSSKPTSVLSSVTSKPERLAEITRRTGWAQTTTYRALLREAKLGKVVRTGSGSTARWRLA